MEEKVWDASSTGTANLHHVFAHDFEFGVKEVQPAIRPSTASDSVTKSEYQGSKATEAYEKRYRRFKAQHLAGKTLPVISEELGISVRMLSSERYLGRVNRELNK